MCCFLVCFAFAEEEDGTSFEFAAGAKSAENHAIIDVRFGYWINQYLGVELESPFWAYTNKKGIEFYTQSISVIGKYKILNHDIFGLYVFGKVGFTHAKNLEYSLASDGEIKRERQNDGSYKNIVLSSKYGFGGNIDIGVRTTIDDIFFFDIGYALTMYWADLFYANHWFGFSCGVIQ